MGCDRIYLVRHTAPAIEMGRCYGSTDVPLDESKFATELPEIARQLPDPALIVTSPLTRCRRLAEAINATRVQGNMQIEHDLRERSFGDWEGLRWDEIAHSQINAWRDNFLDYMPPNGESVRALQTRVTAAWQRLSTPQTAPLIIIAHAGPLAVIRALLKNETLGANAMQNAPPCGSILEMGLGAVVSEVRLR
jgi:alpha-ribazole phosphatase